MLKSILNNITALFLILFSNSIYGVVIDSTDKYAWSENVGWVNMAPSNGSVIVNAQYLAGYAWAENIGYIKMGHDSGGPYANTSAANWGVNRDINGNLSGYAWSENAGWINFNSTHSQVTINSTTGLFEGYAWSENIGWIHFSNTNNPAYKVTLQVGSQFDWDNDGVIDNLDAFPADPNESVDTDGDGTGNNADTDDDDDGMSDGFEVNNELDPLVDDALLDKDEDGLTNFEEYELGLAANDSDTDNDGMSDGYEVDNGFDPLDDSDCPSWMCGSSKIWLYKLQVPPS